MAAVFFTSSEVVIYAGFTRDGQNFKRRDKDDKVEGGGLIVLLCLLCE